MARQTRDDLWLALLCAAATLLSCAAWAWITPPFQAPDEPVHFDYVQSLAETGRPPANSSTTLLPRSTATKEALWAIRFSSVKGNPLGKPPWTAADAQSVVQQLEGNAPEDDGGGPSDTAEYPALYYSLAAVPYIAADALGAGVIGQLTAVRLLSCLLTALTAFFIFFFIRELLPATRLAAPTGALAVGLLPYFGFLGSSVNNDVLLATVSAALFWLLARSFRRGLGAGSAAAIGLVLVAGWITKPTFIGIVPGALLAIIVLLVRAHRAGDQRALRSLAALVFSGGALFALYFAVNRGLWTRTSQQPSPTQFTASDAPKAKQYSLDGLLSYIWQFWLPRPSFLTDQINGPYQLWETVFKGFIGRFGWLEYQFPSWVYSVVLGCWLALLALIGRALVVSRSALRGRALELLCYAAMLAGLIALIGIVGYRIRLDQPFPFEQARYLFPVLALFGGMVGLAVRGAGRRAGPYVAVAIVIATGALDIGGLLLTLGRYYS